ncbi:HTTM domain-containing protein [Corallococcus interemptor]|uniref:HTTM domain-containing protein n=1 Tax=Corallococcus TaxID=83461 RepID=UPI001CBF2A68|nr:MULTISPECIES: HTTM domain-containing protein [unclassified Corallococcus]MBZ4332690.1 HTTM domain-containing protein [Corallococcus sp. AS-1-12]MBZ4375192.1 HTTM domain-containing protein [Corallococcus sp. AS-1-6]
MSASLRQRPTAGQRLAAFIAEPSSPGPLGILRIGVALLLLVQAWSMSDSLQLLVDDRGLVPWSISESLATEFVPRFAALVAAMAPLGLSSEAVVRGVLLIYCVSLVGLLLGLRTRLSAVVAWTSHTVILNSSPFLVYGVETFAHISLFYCAVMPVGEAFSWDVRVGRASGAPSAMATLALRVLQVHLCIIYFATGIEKLLGPLWREGTAIWKVLMQPQYGQFDFAWLASVPWAVKLTSWGTLVVEVGYALFVWPRRTRGLWVAMTVGMHLGIAVMMGLWMFSGMMAMLTFAAFGWPLLSQALATRVRAEVLLPFHSNPAR